MDSVKHVISRVVSRCEKRGFNPSEALAAFVSRTIVYDNEKKFLMDREMTNEALEDLIELTVQRLCEQDSPSLETVKMQVAFDLKYTQSKNRIDEMARLKTNKMNELQRSIVNIKASSGGGFENFTALYRQIFAFLMLNAKTDVTDDRKDRTAEREVAAALESVFPRVALKSFMTMRNEDKRKQLAELTNIVLGIRLFNHEIGKGGQDLQDVPSMAATTAAELATDISRNLAQAKKMCQNYTDVLMYVARMPNVDVERVERWQRELTNRRQYVFYAENLAMDIVQSQRAVGAAMEIFNRELKSLKGVVGQRNSVPKEVVYPKFDLLARNWLQMSRELQFIEAYETTWMQVQKYRQSYNVTLPKDLITSARKSASKMGTDEALDMLVDESDDYGASAMASSKRQDVGDRWGGGAAGAKLLSFETTPEIMNLPLELKGYCAHTLVTRRGLLLPGDVESHGVVQYRNHFYSFASGKAAQAFLANPERFIDGVHASARARPELIHLLGLQDVFPDVSLAKLTDSSGGVGGVHPLLAPPSAAKVDASTETPVHFVEKNIDHNYHWNEWTLRRKAIQLANIRKAKTTGAQTDSSHFKNEATSQVYLPRNNGTQTTVSSGTNPVRSHNYIVGLRGFEGRSKPGVNSRFVRNGANVLKASGSSVVNMSFEV